MNKIILLVLKDIFRNKIILAYTFFLALMSWSILFLEDGGNKSFLTLLNLVLMVIPLFSILFTTIYIYNSFEFIELLVSQPIKRNHIWNSIFTGLALTQSVSFLIAVGLPLFLFVDLNQCLFLSATGILIGMVFTALAFLSSILSRDKAKGIGTAIMVWLFFAIIFDGLVLFLMFQLGDYPIEKPMVLLSAANPIDMARIMNLIQLESSAMLGYTGAIFKKYFSSGIGTIISFSILITWSIIPYYLSLRIFRRRDL